MKRKKNRRPKGTILYECDPNKNTECSKTACKFIAGLSDGAYCSLTTREQFAKENGKRYLALKNGQLIDMDKLN